MTLELVDSGEDPEAEPRPTEEPPPPSCRRCGSPFEHTVNYCPQCGTPATGEDADPLLGRVVAERYKIVELLGRGGMGVVYKCEHTAMGKAMALKLLHGDLARDPEVQRRFRREALAASRLAHPNTVGIFDFGTSDGLMYLAMEYVPGEDLSRLLRAHGPMTPTRVANLVAQACSSLSQAHEAGIVHRDIKPENLLITRLRDGREFVKVLDFGLARLREGEDKNEVTSQGVLLGTPYYMAPEVIRGQSTDHRVDVYALGAVLYRCLTGHPPFGGNSPMAVLTRALTDPLVPPSERTPELQLPAALDAIVVRCLARDPQGRYQTTEALRQDLLAFLAGEGADDSLPEKNTTNLRNALPLLVATTDGDTTRPLPLATRDDVAAFERTLRRRSLAERLSIVGLVALGVAAGAGLYWRRQQQVVSGPRDQESEPNQTPNTATLIAPATNVTGRLGPRPSPGRGDVDLFRLSRIPPGTWRLRVLFTPPPDIDAELELLRSGTPAALAVMNDRGEGQAEQLVNYRVTGGEELFVSVHERIETGAYPRENVSDTYTLRYELSAPRADEELEPDDREEIADALTPAGVTGWIEARGDVDFYCMDTAPTALRWTLTPPPDADLALQVLHRDGHPVVTVDQAHAGGAETLDVHTDPGTRGPCLVVRVSDHQTPQHGWPEQSYTLRSAPIP